MRWDHGSNGRDLLVCQLPAPCVGYRALQPRGLPESRYALPGARPRLMAGMTCDYCGEGDNEKGMVQIWEGGFHQMHEPCWRKYQREQITRRP